MISVCYVEARCLSVFHCLTNSFNTVDTLGSPNWHVSQFLGLCANSCCVLCTYVCLSIVYCLCTVCVLCVQCVVCVFCIIMCVMYCMVHYACCILTVCVLCILLGYSKQFAVCCVCAVYYTCVLCTVWCLCLLFVCCVSLCVHCVVCFPMLGTYKCIKGVKFSSSCYLTPPVGLYALNPTCKTICT